ncbi:MAG: PDGLE domain-containing protein, partial [Kiritimatiellota bacterium]|nr:PDGLE domain-containing protein [Kiritimatiellota bacterium]
LITTLVLVAIARTRPELLAEPHPVNGTHAFEWLAFGLLTAVGLAVFVAPFASSKPDGLEHVAQVQQFEHKAAEKPVVPAPLPDYFLPGIRSPVLATALAGGLGTVLMFGFAFLLARTVAPKQGANNYR